MSASPSGRWLAASIVGVILAPFLLLPLAWLASLLLPDGAAFVVALAMYFAGVAWSATSPRVRWRCPFIDRDSP